MEWKKVSSGIWETEDGRFTVHKFKGGWQVRDETNRDNRNRGWWSDNFRTADDAMTAVDKKHSETTSSNK
jgi:hypothetical protein